MEQPLVSFVVPAFNARRTIDRTLESIRAQDFKHWEAIIVDDGSTDGTARHCSRWLKREPRFRLLRQRNAGASAARNTAIRAARGQFLVFLDADDWIATDFLRVMWPLVKDKGDKCLAYCAYVRVSPTGEHLPPDFCSELMDAPFEFLAERCEPAIHCVVISRQLVLDVGGFDPELATCEDWDLWLRVARCGATFIGSDSPLAFYRMRDGSLSSNNERVDQDALLVLQRAASTDARVPEADPRYVHGKPKETTTAIDWPGYIAALDNKQPALQPLSLEADWIEAVGDIAFAILGLVANERQCTLSTLTTLGDYAIEQYQRYAELVQQAVPLPGLGPLILSKATRLALMETDLRIPKQYGDWLGAELDLDMPSKVQAPNGSDASWVMVRVRRGGAILGYVDLDAATDPARAVLDGLSLVQLVRSPSMVRSKAFWRALAQETYAVGKDQLVRFVEKQPRGRTAKGMARQALRSAARHGLHTWLHPINDVAFSASCSAKRPSFAKAPRPDVKARQFQLPIVVYRIDEKEPASLDDNGISVEAIYAQLTYLQRTGYRTLSMRQLHSHILLRLPVSAKQVVVVLEEATKESLEQLNPVLATTGFTCVVCPRPGPHFQVIERQVADGLLDFPVELGVSVSPLHTFDPNRAILESAVESLIERATTVVACMTAVPPHDLLQRQLSRLGVDIVVGAGSGVADVENCAPTLPRIQVTHGDSLGMFAEKLRCSSWTV